MTSISTATQVYTPPSTSRAHSGKNRMADAIQQQEASGALSSTDATALTSALGSIDSSLSGTSTASTSGSSSGTTLDPSSIKDRIDSLISDQQSSGALTSDQASALKNLFASHGKSVSSSGDSDGDGGGPDGPPPGPPPGGIGSGGSSSGDSSSVGATSGTSGTSAGDLLSTFIQQLQAAQSNGSSYAASGQTSSAQSSALLFDFKS
ncbi:hypothetical protein [Methylobacterium sp. J-076]|uniref:hypothetical protein n=1 Tax=Methylobacterium sp. J-076 TaxID=2836655 RepID=UPI001FBB5EF5|nr:hypothetical protein [Methylobacterium sp. J-076]MCJ2012809.1 hypothetical protein [Methylobacterium sp. J-076]